MTEEKNGVKNGEATTEMAPQEDGTKVPLTNDGATPEVKFTAGATENPPNGEAKVDLGTPPTFSGLSKDELMKYSNDPFWVRLRWAFFILFWAGWVAMLVMAIVIIIQTERCAPKETLLWVQESAMVGYDPLKAIDMDDDGEATPEDMTMLANALGMTTVYLKTLISPVDFTQINPAHDSTEVDQMLKAAKEKNLKIVTDFVPLDVDSENVWLKNPNMSEFFLPESRRLNLTNEMLREKLVEVLGEWVTKGVQGFLISDPSTVEIVAVKKYLSEALEDKDGVVVDGVTDMDQEIKPGFDAATYRSFLQELGNGPDDWSYFKYNPKVAKSTINSLTDLVTLTLFLVRGTPVLNGFDATYFVNEEKTIHKLSKLRETDSVQVGDIKYVNGTSDDVIAFARVAKGTPGYAVAVNMHDVNSTTVDFTSIKGVKGKAEVNLRSSTEGIESAGANAEKLDLSSVELGPLDGIILQFVPSF